MMPVCRGRNWPNGPRTHQGGAVGRPWSWLIKLEFPDPLTIPNPWPDGLVVAPAPSIIGIDFAWVALEPDWQVICYQDDDLSLPNNWYARVGVQQISSGIVTVWRTLPDTYVKAINSSGGVLFNWEFADVPGIWGSILPVRAMPVLYDDLPAGFCSGA